MTKKDPTRSPEDQALGALLRRELPEAPDAPFLESRIWNEISAPARPARKIFGSLTFSGFAGAAGLAVAIAIGGVIQAPRIETAPRVAATPTGIATPFELDLFEGLSGAGGAEENGEESYSVYEMI
jgi:hypothetical protein